MLQMKRLSKCPYSKKTPWKIPALKIPGCAPGFCQEKHKILANLRICPKENSQDIIRYIIVTIYSRVIVQLGLYNEIDDLWYNKKEVTARWYREMLIISENISFCNESQHTWNKGNHNYQVIESVKVKLKDSVS